MMKKLKMELNSKDQQKPEPLPAETKAGPAALVDRLADADEARRREAACLVQRMSVRPVRSLLIDRLVARLARGKRWHGAVVSLAEIASPNALLHRLLHA